MTSSYDAAIRSMTASILLSPSAASESELHAALLKYMRSHYGRSNSHSHSPLILALRSCENISFVSSMSHFLLSHFTSLHSPESMSEYLEFLCWIGESVSVQYLSAVVSVIPKFTQSATCVRSAVKLILILLGSSAVVAHSVLEAVPVDFLLSFIHDERTAGAVRESVAPVIGKAVVCLDQVRESTGIPELKEDIDEFTHVIKDEVLLNCDPAIRRAGLQSLLEVDIVKRPRFMNKWVVERVRDRDVSVRTVLWDHLADAKDWIAELESWGSVPVGDFCTMLELNACLTRILMRQSRMPNQGDQSPLQLLHEWFSRANGDLLERLWESKNFARKIIKSIASTIGSDRGLKRSGIDRERAIRLCLSWYSCCCPGKDVQTEGKTAVAELIDCIDADTIELLAALFQPHNSLKRKLKLLGEVEEVMAVGPWRSLVVHACNLFLDSRALADWLPNNEDDGFVAFLVKNCFEDLSEPGLVDWEQVLELLEARLADPIGLNDGLIVLFGKVDRQDHDKCDTSRVQRLLMKILKISDSSAERRLLVRGLLWSNFDACLEILENPENAHAEPEILVEVAKFAKRHESSQVDRVSNLVARLDTNNRGIELILHVDRWVKYFQHTQNACSPGIITNLVRGIRLNEDVPPYVFALLLNSATSPAEKEALVGKLIKIAFPARNQSDIVAYCGGVRIDIIPILFLLGNSCDATSGGNPLRFLARVSHLSDSNRRLLEYLVSLLVYLGVFYHGDPQSLVESGFSFIRGVVSTAAPSCRDSVVAALSAATRSLEKYVPTSPDVAIYEQAISVKEMCSVLHGALEKVYPGVVRMTIDRTYSMSIAAALFIPRDAGADSADPGSGRNPLVLKRRRVSGRGQQLEQQ